MKKYLFGLLLLASIGYGKKMDVVAKYDYICEKGDRTITYRIAYRDKEGEPPCRVYQIIDGKRTQIGQSLKMLNLCENILDRILDKVEQSGMTCYEADAD